MSQRSLLLLISGAVFILGCNAMTDFAECAKLFTSNNSSNASYLDSQGNSAIYTGRLYGFKGQASDRPLTITTQACKDYCGAAPHYNGVVAAFQVLTTWVLPVLGLMGQLPYESLSEDKFKKNGEAFVNWIGAPGAALATTLWNILTIGKCERIPSQSANSALLSTIKDNLYILSCINQYEYPRHPPGSTQKNSNYLYLKRDQALLRGVLYPYITGPGGIDGDLLTELTDMSKLLAFHLRLQRRRGVYPIYISILWFGVAFGLSTALAFADLGDNSTAHSLALGLLLAWVPIVVFATVIDRNPTSSTHCGEMIARWLFNVDSLFKQDFFQQVSPGADLPPPPPPQRTPPRLWNATDKQDLTPFEIGQFLGQGRKLRYCGVTDTVLKYITAEVAKNGGLPLPTITTNGAETFQSFQKALRTRPWEWYYGAWLASHLIVMTCFWMAFMVSFNTPTAGLGCRSLLYLIWYSLTLPSSVSLLFSQEPPLLLRRSMIFFNILSVLALFAVMLMQTMNGFNSCVCKSSRFSIPGSSIYGGYVDFQNAVFYREHYDVRLLWGLATGIGGGALALSLTWLAWKWQKGSGLWKVTEYAVVRVHNRILLDMII